MSFLMLAFHLYRWNRVKVIPVDSRLVTWNGIPGHRRLFRLALQTSRCKFIRLAVPPKHYIALLLNFHVQ